MNATELKALQAPLKQQYKDTPETAIITLKANGRIGNKQGSGQFFNVQRLYIEKLT